MKPRIVLAAFAAATLAWLAAPAAAQDLAAGKAVYEGACVACHGTGVLGAPKVGDAAAWSARAAGGLGPLLNSAKNGRGNMPARGGNPALSDAQLQHAIAYMLSQSKGGAPAAAAPVAAAAKPAAAAAAKPAP
ncbi:MAG TPA: c-type cytochrome, partial [Ramlibacter sp.]|uniref:c-type cytochrome n=1 Tax=Ramlibacter sp. TaxID=1917967 RepID=UPI002D80FC32